MLPGLHTSFEMSRTKSWRRGKQHHVHATLNDLLISIESHKAMVGIHLNAIFRLLLQDPQAALQAVFEDISHSRQDDVLIRRQSLRSRAGSPAAATHQPHFKRVPIGGKGLLRKAEIGGGNASRRCRVRQKLTS